MITEFRASVSCVCEPQDVLLHTQYPELSKMDEEWPNHRDRRGVKICALCLANLGLIPSTTWFPQTAIYGPGGPYALVGMTEGIPNTRVPKQAAPYTLDLTLNCLPGWLRMTEGPINWRHWQRHMEKRETSSSMAPRNHK